MGGSDEQGLEEGLPPIVACERLLAPSRSIARDDRRMLNEVEVGKGDNFREPFAKVF